jgi:TATA-box binding protein (TBP) (component of TFIID and TFIIIB)
MPKDGVIKKVIKLSSPTPEYLEDIQNRLKKELYYEENVLVSINNPCGSIKFKEVRKISIGISKKDIITYRTKQKKAFSHCFVMILRIKIENEFKEFHVKVFNTGELAIPGVQNDTIFKKVLTTVIDILQPYSPDVLTYKQSNDTVLINSNFNCGFFINRDVLYNIIKFKYNLQAMYEPCSYPGIQCKFYYNYDLDIQTGIQPSNSSKISDNDNNSISNNSNNSNNSNSTISKRIVEMSFMIFRTGSVLIVGMCDEDVIHSIYEFLKSLLLKEFKHIAIGINDANKDKKKKRKIICVVIRKS